MKRSRIRMATGSAALVVAAAVWAQAPPAPPAVPAGAAPPAAATSVLPGTEPTSEDNKAVIEEIKRADEAVMSGKGGYTYDPAGRRDPFVDPLSAKTEDKEEVRPDGSEGMLINEVQLQGITIYGGDPIAVMMGTDGVGYFLREGDELWDGKIIAIDFDEGKVVCQQKVEDPSSPVRFREVVKKLNP